MELDKKAIGQRLKDFLIDRFGNVTEGARILGKNPDNFRGNYFNGKSLPGPEILVLLHKYGCDMGWLLTGTATIDSLNEQLAIMTGERNYYKKELDKLQDEILKLFPTKKE